MIQADDAGRRLKESIPGGAHTYSRGADQFPANAPTALVRGSGAYVWDANGRQYLDYGMGLRSVILGYAHSTVNRSVQEACDMGVNLTLPTMLEIEVAEGIIEQIPSVEMVKFAKHGSVVATGAVRLARSATGRDRIAVARQHPFHSFDDWFIGSTPMRRGVSLSNVDSLLKFDFGNIESLRRVFERHPGQIAAVIMEPATDQLPCPGRCAGAYCLQRQVCPDEDGNFLRQARELCDVQGSLLILDEIITAFRWDARGAQEMFGVRPDLTLLGKALGNGYAISALGGSQEVMNLGAIQPEGMERTFLLSSTHGAEMTGLAAAKAVLGIYAEQDVCGHLNAYGEKLAGIWTDLAHHHGIGEYALLSGPHYGQVMVFLDSGMRPSLEFRTLFMQEMVRNGVLMPWISPSLAHGIAELDATARALDATFAAYSRALASCVHDFLEGPAVKPVFRKFN